MTTGHVLEPANSETTGEAVGERPRPRHAHGKLASTLAIILVSLIGGAAAALLIALIVTSFVPTTKAELVTSGRLLEDRYRDDPIRSSLDVDLSVADYERVGIGLRRHRLLRWDGARHVPVCTVEETGWPQIAFTSVRSGAAGRVARRVAWPGLIGNTLLFGLLLLAAQFRHRRGGVICLIMCGSVWTVLGVAWISPFVHERVCSATLNTMDAVEEFERLSKSTLDRPDTDLWNRFVGSIESSNMFRASRASFVDVGNGQQLVAQREEASMGWPLHCLKSRTIPVSHAMSDRRLVADIMRADIVWPKLLANAAILTAACLLLRPRTWRQANWLWKGRCLSCGYPLQPWGCPECGLQRGGQDVVAPASQASFASRIRR